MIRLRFLLRTAVNHLWRGEQRVWAAVACIAFGVMSLLAMTLIAESIRRTLVLEPRQQIGADISLSRRGEDTLRPGDDAQLRAWREAGLLEQYLLVAEAHMLLYRRPDSGEVHFASTALGIDPDVYPLAGALSLAEPAGASLPALLRAPGDLVITRDVAEEQGLRVGDTLVLSDLRVGAPVTAVIRGIAADTPNHQGSKFYYTHATAAQLAGGGPYLTLALAATGRPDELERQAASEGWDAYPAAAVAAGNRQTDALIQLLLKGAGLLGLMVGGIGIANTMQVLLRRRQREVAVWKTLGYTAGELQVLFTLEAGLLGLAGSLLGAGLGVLVSAGLLKLLARTGNLLLVWAFSPALVAGGVLVGVATTVIFALWAIVRTAQVPPLALLRQEALAAPPATWLRTLLLAAVLGLPFTAVTSLVMGSLGAGVGVVLFALAGLIGLGGVLGGLAWAATHLLGGPGLPLLRLARSSLRRRGWGLVFAMIALYTGVVALAFGLVMTQSAQREMGERTVAWDSYEVAISAPAAQEAAVRAALSGLGVQDYAVGYSTTVRAIHPRGDYQRVYVAPHLIGQTELRDYAVTGAPWLSAPDGAYAPAVSGLPIGARVDVTRRDGATRTLVIVGTYTVDYATSLRPEFGLLVPAELGQRLAAPDTLMAFVETPARQAAALSAALGRALPEATVINMLAYAARFTQAYRNLFVLAVAMASLALLAGVLLVANSVTLAMLDRRYEIGVLKAVGYTRAHVLAALAAEYVLMAAVATGAGLLTVQIALWIMGLANPLAASLLVMEPGGAAAIGATGVALTLLTVLGATWQPTAVSPAVVLNDRE